MLVPIISLLIPIIAILGISAIVILSIALKHRSRKEMFALYHQERMVAIEKGIELPPVRDSLFLERSRQWSPRRHLLFGLILLFGGSAAFYSSTYISRDTDAAEAALVAIGIGLAFFLYYFLVGRKEAERIEAAQKAALEEKANRPL